MFEEPSRRIESPVFLEKTGLSARRLTARAAFLGAAGCEPALPIEQFAPELKRTPRYLVFDKSHEI